jgi:hypothetical protein
MRADGIVMAGIAGGLGIVVGPGGDAGDEPGEGEVMGVGVIENVVEANGAVGEGVRLAVFFAVQPGRVVMLAVIIMIIKSILEIPILGCLIYLSKKNLKTYSMRKIYCSPAFGNQAAFCCISCHQITLTTIPLFSCFKSIIPSLQCNNHKVLEINITNL